MKLFITVFLIGVNFTLSQTNPTLKESFDDLKKSVKEVGEIFKKDKKNENTNIKEENTQEIVSQETISSEIISLIYAYNVNLDKSIKLTKTEYDQSVQFVANYSWGDSTVYLSKIKEEHVFGDLYSNQIEDAVIKVYSNTGGNTDYLDLYFLEYTDNKWILKFIISSSDETLKGCEIGQFIPDKIESGNLVGISYCFTDTDPRCCPSLKKSLTIQFQDKNFKIIKSEKL